MQRRKVMAKRKEFRIQRRERSDQFEAECPKCQADFYSDDGALNFCVQCGTELEPHKV